jgi:CBS domain-containing protein
MTTAADIMHHGVYWIPAGESLVKAAQMMRELDIAALPISDANNRMCGILTDRDIVLECVAKGYNPAEVTAGALAQGTPRWVRSDADVSQVLDDMQNHQVRRLPVIEDKQLVGMITEADLAQHLDDDQLTHWVEDIYTNGRPQRRNAGKPDLPSIGEDGSLAQD